MNADTQSPLMYRIFRDKHGIPQFEPKRGTQALKDALIYSFPTLETELQLMQAALRKFFDNERGSKFVYEVPENDLQVSLARGKDKKIPTAQLGKSALRNWKATSVEPLLSQGSSRASSRASSRPETPTSFQDLPFESTLTTWKLSSGEELEKRKRQPYDPVKRRKVAENRGNACEKHRISKTTCDPYLCPQNKRYGHAVLEDIEKNSRAPSRAALMDGQSETRISGRNKSTNRHNHLPSEIMDVPSVTSNQLQDDSGHDDTGNPHMFRDTSEQIIAFGAHDPQMTSNDPESSVTSNFRYVYDLHSKQVTSTCHALTQTKASACQNLEQVCGTRGSNETFIKDQALAESLRTASLDLVDHDATFTGDLLHFSHETYSASLMDAPYQMYPGSLPDHPPTSSSQLPYSHSEKQFEPTEDPFMGWGSKRASQMLEDHCWNLNTLRMDYMRMA